jgi:monoterpene epsilon-lactone hydrolase
MTKRGSATALDAGLVFEDALYSFSGGAPKPKGVRRGEPWPGIIETLYSEHGFILSLLRSLEREARKLKGGKIPDYHLLLEMVDYLVNYPGEFHHPREDLLFSALLKSDRTFKPKLERLQREHETLRFYSDKLFVELSQVVDGRPADRNALISVFDEFIAAYRKHIDYETREIFPLAKGSLTAAELKKAEAKTRFIDDPLFGGEVARQYRRLGRRLQVVLAGVGDDLATMELRGLEPAIEKLGEVMGRLDDIRERFSCEFGSSSRRARKARPSWQARVMNACTRTFMKPMMRFGSVESMRGLLSTIDSQGERIIPGDIKAKFLRRNDFEGEWVQVAGKRPRKVILYFPGGGFIMRTPTQHKGMVAKICRAAGAKALIVHYSLAPEIPFPGGLEDCLAAYHYLLEQGHKPADITIAGDSAGGGLVLSTLLALRDEGSPQPGTAIVLSPLADLTYSGGSRKFNKYKDPMLPTHRASEMHELYIGESLPEDRFISPIFADFDGLPPMLGLVGSTEILLDDTVRAAAKAEASGVPFYLEVWEQMPHVFPIFGMLPEAEVAIERMAEFINRGELGELPEEYACVDYARAS